MYYLKKGLPQEEELVLCTVTSVQYNSVFCDMDEYPGKGGMIHISEVTAGRIRNIREFVQEGRKIVCKVLYVDAVKGHIDLSLRRVNERQRIEKMAQIKHEGKAENLLQYIAKELKKDPAAFYEEVATPILAKYEYVYQAFEDIVEGNFSLEKDLKFEKKLATRIEELVRERIKPKQVQIEGDLHLLTYAPNGVALVREALVAAREIAQPADIRYLGGGNFRITVTAEEYKDAEKRLGAAVESVEKAFKKVPSSVISFARSETD